jgi:2-succinyl-5-enolpyruvyl-6-hydroxy-3-cyclohexene-1-carboxylate synthase
MSAYPFAAEFFSALAASGVRHVCISPGARSAPLAISASRDPGLDVSTHVDERSAAFFALGLSRATREPVVLVCTSGTAAANFLPAVVEAHHAHVPLIVLTADRPPELRDCGAGQTVDQTKLFGDAAHWFFEVDPNGCDERSLRIAAGLASRAVAESLGHARRGAGPVHLNWPLREPLEPRDPGDDAPALSIRGHVAVARPEAFPDEATVDSLAQLAARHEAGWIACGPADLTPREVDAVAALARATGWPIVADAASGLRSGPHVDSTPVVDAADVWLRDADLAADHGPDLVVRLGPTPVSKALRLQLEARPPAELVVVDPTGDWQDPSHLATRVVTADVAPLCERWTSAITEPRGTSGWTRRVLALDSRVREALEGALIADLGSLNEPAAVRALCASLPDDTILYVSNSMPIRHLEAFWPASSSRIRVLANRGANGIDGVTSSALGAAASGERVVLLTGDLAFLHDLGGLLAAIRHGLQATVVVLENNGGGIFSFLPVAAEPERSDFDQLFRVSHGLDLSHAADLFGARFERTRSSEVFRKALESSLRAPGLSIIEVPIDRDASLAAFRSLMATGVREGGRA